MAEQAARFRYVNERALARISKKPALADTTDENIRPAVVVVVADCNSHSIELDVETRSFRHVGERAVAIVAIEPESSAPPLMAGPIHPVQQQNVQPTVAVVVKERAAGAERLGKKLSSVGSAVMLKFDARGRSHICKMEAEVVSALAVQARRFEC